jgi:TonB family protein
MGTLTFKKSVSYSVVIHALLLLLTLMFAQTPRQTLTTPSMLIEIVDQADSRQKTQVVQTEKSETKDKPTTDAFLGEHTQTVTKQTVSIPKNEVTSAQTKKASKNKTETIALSKLGVPILTQNNTPQKNDEEKEDPAALSSQAKGEYVKGFKSGEKTLLNTREFVFYGYFQRIREKLDRAWDRSLKDKLQKYFNRGRQLASAMEYVTQLLVTLDHDGQVVRVQVMGESGTRDLDEAAVKAFNDAGPFPNPPKGLVSSGKIEIRWDFVLKT